TGSPLTFSAIALSLPATQLLKISGDNQDSTIGSPLADPLVVEVRNDNDLPVSGVAVAFEVLSGGGSLSTSQQATDSTGRASAVWTLGSNPGPNTTQVSSPGLMGSPLTFSATGLALPATRLVKISGDAQSGYVDSTLSEVFVVEARNSANEPVRDVPITFQVISGGGSLLNGSLVMTDTTGRATNLLTLGSAPGVNNVRVTANGLIGSPLTFTAVGRSLPPTEMVKVSGDNQSAFVDSTLAEPLVVEIQDAIGTPVRGVPVQFKIISGGGVLSNNQVQLTAPDGRASVFLTLGSQPSTNLVGVTSDSLSGKELIFTAAGLLPPATEMIKVSGDNQSAFIDSTLAGPLVVEIRNAFGGPVGEIPVQFEVLSGGGALSNSQPQFTGSDGRVSTFWTLGGEPGLNTVRVTSDSLLGVTLTFSAMGSALPATQLVKISGDNQSAFMDSTLDSPFVVEVQNAAGQPVVGATVNFQVVLGGGTLSSTQPITTGADGRAEALLALGSLSGENQVRVTSTGLSGSPMFFSATAFARSVAQLVKISGDNQIAFLDSTLAESFVVQVRDATGAVFAGVPITFEVTSGGGRLIESQPQLTGADGRAASTLTVGGIPGINNVRVRSDGLAGSPLFFTTIARALPPTQLIEISGGSQSAFVDSTLAEPFVVEVRNSADQPVEGVEVRFKVTDGGGTLSNSPRLTDDNGRVSTVLTLGGLPGENVVTVSSDDLTGSPFTFTAAGIALPATQLVQISGDHQNAFVDSTLLAPLVVEVRNVANEPVSGVSVSFEVISGGGNLSTSVPQLTDNNGRASVTWTLGPFPGENTVRAHSDGLEGSPLVFTATALPLPPSQLLRVSGDNQSAFVDSTLLEPLVVEVRNAADEPVSGVPVVFDIVAGGGSVNMDSLLTDTNGRASVVWTLGSEGGENRIHVHSPAFASDPISFMATALELPPTQLIKISGDLQTAFVDSTVLAPLVVEVRNVANEPVSGVSVVFDIVAGGGNVSMDTLLTDSAGRASVTWTLGSEGGENRIHVYSSEFASSLISFSATALELPPAKIVPISGDNQSAFLDSTLARPLVVEVRNAADEPVSGISVVFDVVAGSGGVSIDTLLTDGAGGASVFWTLGNEGGENRIHVHSPAFASDPISFMATALELPPTQLIKISGDLQTAFVDSTLLAPLVVEVRNIANEPVSGVSVSFEVVSDGGSLSTSATQLTDNNGRASVDWTLGLFSGENTVRVHSDGLDGSPLVFTATALPLPPNQLLKVSGDHQSAFVDSTLLQPLVVEVRNAADEPVSGVSVVFDVVSGGGSASMDTLLTDSAGRASVVWTLGSEGGENRIHVHSPAFASEHVVFIATGLELPLAQIVRISGDNQSTFVDSTLPQPLVIEVRNTADEPVSGVLVVFDIVAGGGSVNMDSLLTDTNGRASIVWTLGSEGGENRIHVHSPAFTSDPISFIATAFELPPTQLVKISGDQQSAFVDSTLPEPIEVEVRNAAGVAVPGVPVNFLVFVGGGQTSVTAATTGADGRASAIWIVGDVPGENQVQVESSGLAGSSLVFTATALALPAQQLVQISGNNQTAFVDSMLAEPLMVEVRNIAGQPMPDVKVSFTVVAGGGSFSAIQDTTSSNGRVSARFRLGSDPGENRVEVRVDGLEGSPLTFVANGVALPAKQLVIVSGNNQNGQVGTALVEPLVVGALDADGGPVAGVPVSFEVTVGGGILLNAQPQLTDAAGRAVTVLVLGPEPGTNTVSASFDGLSGPPVEFSANGIETTAELKFTPTDDTYIRSNKPRNEYGNKTTMYVIDAATDYVCFTKFMIEGLESPVRSAKLRLKAVDGGSDGGVIHSVSNNEAESDKPWSEEKLNWNNAPPRPPSGLDSLSAVSTGSVVEFDVTPAISGNGIFSFAIRGRSKDLVKYSSKEGSTAPELVLTVGQAGGVSQLVEISGNDQTSEVATSLSAPFVVETRDANDFPVVGVPVRFEVVSGNGTLSTGQPQVTDANGRASTILTLGSVAGENRVRTSVESGILPGVTFRATGLPRRFSLTLNTDGNGSVDAVPASTEYNEGATVTLTALADSGWSFVGWSGDSDGTTNPLTLSMNSDKSLTATFSEIPPQQFTLTVTSEGSGSVTLNPPGDQYVEGTQVSVTATPDSGWVFSHWSGDAAGASNPLDIQMDSDKGLQATFIPNASPIALDDQFTLAEDDSLIVAVPGVLENDSDADGDSLKVQLLSSSSSGDLALNEDGSFSYFPEPDFAGSDQFGYTVEDGKGGMATASVDINVTAVNDAPMALDDQYTVETDRLFSLSAPGVLTNDSDIDSNTLMASLTAVPTHGFVNLAADGSFTYTPNAGFVGTDVFTYRVEDNLGATAVARVTMVVSPNEVVHEETLTGGSKESKVVTTAGAITGMRDNVYLAAITSKPVREVSFISGLGLSWTRIRRQCGGRNQTGVEVWVAHGTPIADEPVSATFLKAPKNAAISVSRYSGVDVTEPVTGVVSANSNGVDGACSSGRDQDAYAVGFATTTSKAMVYAALATRERTHSPGTGYTERAELIHGGGGGGAGVAIQDSIVEQTSSLNIDGSFSNDVDWALVGLELKPGGGAAQPSQFNLSIATEGTGTVTLTPPGGSYPENTIVTMTANPDTGWVFSAWTGDIDGSERSVTLLMNGNKAVVARFTEVPPVEFTLDVSVQGPGSVLLDPSEGVYQQGTQVLVTAHADSGATFIGWGGDLSGLQSAINVTMDSDKTISATFVTNQPPLVANDFYNLNEDD
ncbi:tandem-95 repeat protein, partial [bacterium]|nr:tandem-95 repeat protein [bacterium]